MMTAEEREQYNRLPYADREEYDHIARKRPNWSHSQIMTKVGLSHTMDKKIGKGEDIDPDDPTVIKEILKGAKDFLIGVGLFIADVFEAIDEALTYVGNKLKEFWDWLWD
jgi:hypothetical protein